MKSQYSTLSDKFINYYLSNGEILIDPYNKKNLNTSSYDVTLGEYYFRETIRKPESCHIYNMYSESDVKRIWGTPLQALTSEQHALKLNGISEVDKIILIEPGETILAHTTEFIGGSTHITTMMKSRSSLGRNFIEVCKCAGWGDVGYTNRWTLEITNNSRHYTIPLVVGRRIAQIIFFDVGEIEENSYIVDGKYQTNKAVEELKNTWKPEDMLPKMFKDFEVK